MGHNTRAKHSRASYRDGNTACNVITMSNEFIERRVQTIKKTIKKCRHDGNTFHIAMMNIRTTPIDAKLPSPVEMLLGRPIATLLPSRVAAHQDYHQYKEQMEYRQQVMKYNFDKTAGRPLPPLYKGQAFRVLNIDSRTWTPVQVVGKSPEPRSYHVKTDLGHN